MTEQFQKVSKSKQRQSAQGGDGRGFISRVSPVLVATTGALLLSALIAAALGFWLFQSQVETKRARQLDAFSLQRATLAAANIELYLSRLKESVAQFARKPLLIRAVESGDKLATDRFVASYQGQLENVIKVRLFKLGEAALDSEIFPPIRFSELEMIGMAERQKPVLPEAAKIENDWLLTLVEPIVNENTGTVYGTVMVHVRTAAVERQMAQSHSLGKISLWQAFDSGRPQLVVDLPADTVGPEVEVPVSGSHWLVRFAPGPALLAQVGVNPLAVLATIAVLSALLLAFAAWTGRRVGLRFQAAEERKARRAWEASHGGIRGASGDPTDPAFLRRDILDVVIADEHEALLALDKEEREADGRRPMPEKAEPVAESEPEDNLGLAEAIFRAYDIRGQYGKEITKDVAYLVGQALGSEAQDVGDDTLIVARDARLHSPQLTEFLIRGILSTGCNVLNIGTVPTPLLYFATETLKDSASGVMVTASHNPAEDNGFKVVMGGKCRSEQDIKAIRARILSKNIYSGAGQEKRYDIVSEYINTIFSDVALAGDISIVIDAANAVPGIVAPRLFEELGCQVTSLNCELDGSFPNHPPDPSVEDNLQSLITRVKEVGADLGIALDGDGDRVVVVSPKGKIIWPDRLLMLFARDIVARNPGADVVFDVKSTRHLANVVTSCGGRPIIWKTGHSPMKLKMAESGALLGGEYSGHIFIKDRWYGFDDGLYAAARLIEILSLQGQTLDEVFAEFPESPSTPEIRVQVPESKKFYLVQELIERGEFGDGKKTTLDGLRIDYSNGWGLVRASNTSAHLTMRFEADDEDSLHTLKALFVRQLREIDSTLKINWDQ